MVPEGRRAGTDIDDHVDDPAVEAADELAHRRVPLEVKPAHDAALGHGLDRLSEVGGQAGGVQVRADPRLEQEAALVGKGLGDDDLDGRELFGFDAHRFELTGSGSMI